MKVSLTLLVVSLLSTIHATTYRQRASFNALHQLMKREVCPGRGTCAEACGPGNIECVTATLCYNPSAGETCCSNGNYCPAEYYCVDNGCCPNGSSLADCGASATVATIAPPISTSPPSTSLTAGTSPLAPTTPAGLTPVPYANTTFTKGKTSAAGTTAAESTPVHPVEPGRSTAYSTTTIPQPGGGFVTSTAFTVLPTVTASASPSILQASHGESVLARGTYGVVWGVLTGVVGLLVVVV